MADTQTITDPPDTVVAAIRELLKRRGTGPTDVRPESGLLADLAMESLELAELSVALADELGRDPFSEGLFPETVAELIAFYAS